MNQFTNRQIADFAIAVGLGVCLVTLILSPLIGGIITLLVIIMSLVLVRKGY